MLPESSEEVQERVAELLRQVRFSPHERIAPYRPRYFARFPLSITPGTLLAARAHRGGRPLALHPGALPRAESPQVHPRYIRMS